MISFLLAFCIQVEVAPPLPAGCNEWLQKSVIAVTDALEKKDFGAARRLIARLPRREVTVLWNDTNVAQQRRGEFAAARDAAFTTWKTAFPDLKFKVGSPAQISVSFVDALPSSADSGGPAGAVFFASPEDTDPATEAVVALHRTAKRHTIEQRDVANEIRFAIGMYFGLERSPTPGTVMGRSDLLNNIDSNLAPLEVGTVKAIFKVVDALADAVAKSKSLLTAKPVIYAEPSEIKIDEVLQGDVAQFSLSITNRGNASLNYRVVPDCGCLIVGAASALRPGETGLVQVGIQTAQFVGEVNKNLFVYSNDPDAPVKRIPVSLRVDPIYRFVRNRPHDVLLPDGKEISESVYLLVNDKAPFVASDLQIAGVNATATLSKWEGEIADTEMNEGLKKRKGYKIDVRVPASIPPGRSAILLTLKTDNQNFPYLSYNLFTQAGIEKSPQSIYLGEITRSPARAWVILTRPRIGFKIEKVVCSHPSLTAKVEALRDDWEYKIIVQFDGKVQLGSFIETVDVYTNDPKQKVIQIPVQAIIQ